MSLRQTAMDPTAAALDATFSALADPVRRAIVGQLVRGPRSVTELARPFEMSLPGVLKHLRALEAAGLVTTSKRGRVRTCALDGAPLRRAAEYLGTYERFWSTKLDALERHLHETAPKERKR